jgi:hypothetical protein
LVQAKRPDYLRGWNAQLSRYGIRGEYWRFKVDPHQQSLLEKVAHHLGHRAVVSYACAAFHTRHDLYHHIDSISIIEHSTFVPIRRMISHGSWNYNSPGSIGLGCSEPELIEDSHFLTLVERAVTELRDEEERVDIASSLRNIADVIFRICVQESNVGNPIAQRLVQAADRFGLRATDENQPVQDFQTVAGFAYLANAAWFVLG